MAVLDAATHAAAPRLARFVLFRNVLVLVGSQLTTWCVALAWAVIVPRTIGPSQMGVYTLGVASGGILTVLIGLGMRPLLVREIAIDQSRAPQLIGTAMALRLIISLPVLAGVTLVALLGPFGHEDAIALCLGWGICIFFLLYEPIQAAFQAFERMQYLAYSDVLTKAGVTVVGIALVLLGVRALGLLITSIAVMSTVMVLNLLWIRRVLHVQWRVSRRQLWSLLVESLPYWSFAAFFTIYLWVDSLMLGLMTPSSVLGWYGLPTKLFGTLMFVPVILSTAWLPQLVGAAQQGLESFWKVARSSIELVLFLSLPIAAGTVIVARPLIHLLYGDAYAESVPVLIILALCLPPMYVNTMIYQVLIARRRQMTWTKVMLFASVVNPAVNLVLIPHFQRTAHNGAIGAAWSLLITEVAILAIGLWLIRSVLSPGMGMRVLKAAVATAAMAATATVVLAHLGLIAAVAAGTVVFVASALVLRVLSRDERAQLSELSSALTARLRPRRTSTPA